MTLIKDATLSGAKWGAIEKFSVQGIRFVLSLIMARLLAPTDYGQVSIIMIFIMLSDTLVDSGFNNALIRKKNHTEEDYSTVFYFNVIIALVCYGVLWFMAPFVAKFFNMPLLCSLLRVQSLSVIINSLLAVQVSRLTIALNFRALAKCSLMASLLSGVVGVALAYIGMGVWALVGQTIISCIINLICVCWFCRWFPLLSFSKTSFHEMFAYGSKLLASSIINKLYQNLTTFIIGKFYSSKDLGFYDRGTGLAFFPTDSINGIMQKVTFPIMAKIQDDEARLIEVYRKYIKMLSMVIFFSSILLAALAKPLIYVVLGAKWSGAVIFCQIYVFSVCFNHIDVVNLNLLYIKGRSDLVLKLEFIKKTLSTLVLIASIPFGLVAICISRVIHTQITIISDSYYIGKFYSYGFINQCKDIWHYFLISLIACFPAFVLSFFNFHNLLIIFIGIVSASAIYYIMLRDDQSMIELMNMIKSQLKYKIR